MQSLIMNRKLKGYDGLDRIVFVMNRGSRASKVIDLINFKKDGFNNIMSNELEVGVTKVVQQVLFPSGEEVINDDDIVTAFDETVNKVASDETCTAGDQNPVLPLAFQGDAEREPGFPL